MLRMLETLNVAIAAELLKPANTSNLSILLLMERS
jgi:hypothetical protein